MDTIAAGPVPGRVAGMRLGLCLMLGGAWAATSIYGAWHTIAYNAGPFLGETMLLEIGAAVATAGLLVLLLCLRRLGMPVLAGIFRWLDRGGEGLWLTGLLLLAITLRVAWCLAVPPVQVSDTALYFQLGEALASGNPYRIETPYPTWTRVTWASWPPGLPLALAPVIWLFGANGFVPLLLNLLLISVTLVASYALTGRIADRSAARLVGLAIAASPNLVMLSGQASKELLALALVTAAAALIWDRPFRDIRAGRILLAGACQGACLLTQPAFILLPALPAVVLWLSGDAWRQIVRALVLTIAGAVVVVGPWTVRNALVLGEFVLVSTGGGSILYRANHDQANGGYLSLGEGLPYERLPEVEQDRRLRHEAMQWIRDNPGRFASVVFLKHRNYLGDDSSGPYSSLKRSNAIGDIRYVLSKGLTNGIWLAALLLLGLLVPAALAEGRFATSVFSIHVALLWMYLFAVHTLAESGGRHHLALTGLLLVFLVAELRRRSRAADDARAAGTARRAPSRRTRPAIARLDETVLAAKP
jgi:hypothetical protein